MESSTAAAGAQWATSESSVAAVWSALQYKSGSFEISERERERGISTRIGSVNFELDTRSTPRCPIGHLGWEREGGRGWGLPPPLPTSQGARLGTWGGEERGEGEGSAPPLPTSQGA